MQKAMRFASPLLRRGKDGVLLLDIIGTERSRHMLVRERQRGAVGDRISGPNGLLMMLFSLANSSFSSFSGFGSTAWFNNSG